VPTKENIESNQIGIPDSWIGVLCSDEEHGDVVAYCHPVNAPVIAASTELLAALEMQEMAEADPEASRRKGYFDTAREMRRAAIKKTRNQ
jgi:hypothetical protein